MGAKNVIFAMVHLDEKTPHMHFLQVLVTRDGRLTVREAIFALAPTLGRMHMHGFELAELTEKLHDKGIKISVPMLCRYLNAWRRQKAKKARHTPPSPTDRT